ncbi:MAG: LacI family DNA-binding transcriptional regulator [Actinomycetota bacterium]
MEGQDVSLQDVARAAGVSPATVSRALNGRAGVRDEVRTRVNLVADGLGYRPNRAAKNLAGGRTSLMALVLGSHELTSDPYASAIVQSVAKAARQADEGLMLLLDTQRPNESVNNLVADGLVEGVIISATAVDQRWVEELLDARMPTVLLGAHPTRLDVPVVEVENRTSSARMVGHMLDSGCRRVATIIGDPVRVCTVLRLDGYRDAHHQRQLEPDPELIFEGDFTYASARRVADRILAADVDAVFAGNDEMATAVIHAAIERGIDIPNELSVAGFDGLALSRLAGMTLSTVEQPFDEMAARAVSTLVDRIEGLPTPMGQLVDPRLILGSTTRSDGSAVRAPTA